ncbi:MAG: fibronectin type III domain-containing protein [Acidobacteriota bacterium]
MLRHHSQRPARRAVVSILALLLLFVCAGSASAASFVRVADADLAEGSDRIVLGLVRTVDLAAGEDRPRTAYEVEILEHVVGGQSVDTVTVDVPGGEVDGRTLRVSGVPVMAEGERVLLFLKQRDDGTWGVRHLIQGLFRITTVDGRDLAYRDFDGVEELPYPGRKVLHPEQPRDLEGFVSWLRQRAAAPRPADYFVDTTIAAPTGHREEKFTLLTNSGLNIRWRQFDTGTIVSFRSHNSNQPGLASGGHTEFQAAIQAWNNDPATPINLRYDGRTNATGGLTDFDGVNAILWDNPNGAIDEPFDCGSGGTIAIGGPWFNSATRHMFNGATYITTAGGDIVTNSNLACWIGAFRRAEEVFTHELGHALGLGHSCGDPGSGPCNTTAKNEAIMRAFAHGDNRGGRLGSDDRAAIGFLYGVALTPPDAPSGLSANAGSSGQINLSWVDNSTNESSFQIERRIGGGSFSQIASVGANVRNYTDGTAPSGTLATYQVRASNSAGNSDFSNSASATTTGEPPPSNLTATALDATRVRLDWVDNAVAETGFEIEADGFGVYVPVATPAADTTSVTIGDLNPNTEYDFRVRSTGGPNGRSTVAGPVSATTLNGVPNDCVETDERMCLNSGRFRVQVFFTDGDDNVSIAQVASAGTNDSGLFWFFDENNLEILVKVLDACGLNQNFWVLSAATTNLAYTLVVTDSETGTTAVYTNAAGDPAPAVIDVGALPVCAGMATTPSDPVSESEVRHRSPTVIDAASSELSSALSAAGKARVATKESCGSGDDLLCLNGDRFQVEVDFRSADTSGRGQAVPVAADSGLFWFFSADNWEMLVKVLDACGVNQRFWVFSAATTDVEYTLRVTDTMTGQVRTYSNPLGELAPAVVDIEAFDTCP